MNTAVLTLTLRPDGGLCLHSSDPIHKRGKINIANSFSGVSAQVESQKSGRETSGVPKLGKGGKSNSLQEMRLKHSHNLAPAQLLPLGRLVQVGHKSIAWLVAEMAIEGRIASRTITVPNVDQVHMLQACVRLQ